MRILEFDVGARNNHKTIKQLLLEREHGTVIPGTLRVKLDSGAVVETTREGLRKLVNGRPRVRTTETDYEFEDIITNSLLGS